MSATRRATWPACPRRSYTLILEDDVCPFLSVPRELDMYARQWGAVWQGPSRPVRSQRALSSL